MNLTSGHLTAKPYKYTVYGSKHCHTVIQGFTSDNGKTFKWYVMSNPNIPQEDVFPQYKEFASPELALQALEEWENSR